MASGLRQCMRDVSPYLLLLIAISTLGPLQFGFHLAELNAPEAVITCRKKSIATRLVHAAFPRSADGAVAAAALPDCIPMDNAAFAAVSSIFTAGGLMGALGGGPTSSRRGRLFAMRLTSLFYVAGSALEALAGAVPVLALGRLLSGVGAGASTVIVPLYISEIAPPRERGFFGVMTQISINVGIVATQALGYFLSHDAAWRWVLAAGVAVALLQGLGLVLIPESPAWLAAHAGVARAKAVLQRIRGRDYDIQEEVDAWGAAAADAAAADPEEEGLLRGDSPPADNLSGVTEAGPGPGSPKADDGAVGHMSILQVVRDPVTRPAIIAVVGIMLSQQLCGINSIIMYSTSLLADLLPISSALLTILVSVINLITTVACAPLPDKLGRKTCLLLSIAGQGTSAFCLALSILYETKILSAVLVLFFVGFFAVGLGPVPFIMASEMVGQEAVGAAQSWALCGSYVATFLVAQFFPLVNEALNAALGGAGWVYFLFTALAAACGVFVWLRVPETRGRRNADEVWGRVRRVD